MVGRRGTIKSACGHCGAEIAVEVDGKTLLTVQPAEAVVAYGGLTDCTDRPSLEASCPYINFFCSLEHARAWNRPTAWQGRVLAIDKALALAVERFEPVIAILRHHSLGETS